MAAVEDPAGREASRQHLSDHHSFVLCDAKVSGCPIRHASDGFKDMFRYAVGESPARTDKIDGCSSIMDSEAGVVAAARAGGLSPQDVVKALQLLENVAADVCTGIASGSRVGQSSSVLLVKARRGGEMFACLLSLVLHRHPTTGWSFLVGLHKDISDHLAVRDLLRAALSGGPSVQAILGGLTTHIGVQQGLLSHPQSVVHLNEAFDKVWRGFLSGLGRMGESGSTGGHAGAGEGGKHHSGLGGKQSKLKAARSEVSAATTASRVSTGRRACGGTVATTSPTLPPAVAKWRSEMPPSEWNDLSESPLHNNLLDLLEPVDDSHLVTPPQTEEGASRRPDAPSFDESAGSVRKKELCELDYPFAMFDPSKPGLPAVVCSAGLASFMDRPAPEGEIEGMVLREMIAELEVVEECKAFCEAAMRGEYHSSRLCSQGLARLGRGDWHPLAEGELVCIQAGTKRSGEQYESMVYLKQLELNDRMYVVCLQAHIPDDVETAADPGEDCHRSSFRCLDERMDALLQTLAAHFWFSAPMRRQTAFTEDF